MNKNTMMMAGFVLIVIAAVVGFWGGMQYQKSQRASFAGGQFSNGQGMGQGRFGGQNGQNFRPVRGQVLSMDSSSLTVKLSDGSTKIVVLSGTTAFLKTATASVSDLKTGDTVNVIGTQNSDGSVTAQDVQINPVVRPTAGASK